MKPDAAALYETVEATWPAASVQRVGPWIIRDGRGGGKRASAATAAAPVTEADIAQAEAAQRALGQAPLFMIRDGEGALDATLAARGYHVVDPVVQYLAPTALLAQSAPDPMAAFAIWPPLGIMVEIWADAGIGAGRLAVMERVQRTKTALLGRKNDRAAGVAFVALNGKIAMLHALEVAPDQRRQGSANSMLRRAAIWAQDQGAEWFSLVVTTANAPARKLYSSLGMEVVGQYHYRTT